MKAVYSERFRRSYEEAPAAIKRAFDRKIDLLLANLRRPSLQTKKYDESRDIWQGRVTQGWRFYFSIAGDTYVLLDIVAHPK